MNLKYHLTLGSKSPRRKSLLEALGLDFEVRSQATEEHFPDTLAVEKVAEFLAIKKAEAFTLKDQELLITADTTVIHQNKVLNKASDATEAFAMLQSLSNSTHHVVSGVCLRTHEMQVSFSESTKVIFEELTEEMIHHYIQHYQPFDKAGAYGIQEWIGMVGVSRIEGDYYNVMGLPLHKLYQQLKNFI